MSSIGNYEGFQEWFNKLSPIKAFIVMVWWAFVQTRKYEKFLEGFEKGKTSYWAYQDAKKIK